MWDFELPILDCWLFGSGEFKWAHNAVVPVSDRVSYRIVSCCTVCWPPSQTGVEQESVKKFSLQADVSVAAKSSSEMLWLCTPLTETQRHSRRRERPALVEPTGAVKQ